jgi:sulfur transfer complex TusBCD TusB component (DsrH family)
MNINDKELFDKTLEIVLRELVYVKKEDLFLLLKTPILVAIKENDYQLPVSSL